MKIEYGKMVSKLGHSDTNKLEAEYVRQWPWWHEIHSLWRDRPNYNPIAVSSSDPDVDHSAELTRLFSRQHGDLGTMARTADSDSDSDGDSSDFD